MLKKRMEPTPFLHTSEENARIFDDVKRMSVSAKQTTGLHLNTSSDPG